MKLGSPKRGRYAGGNTSSESGGGYAGGNTLPDDDVGGDAATSTSSRGGSRVRRVVLIGSVLAALGWLRGRLKGSRSPTSE